MLAVICWQDIWTTVLYIRRGQLTDRDSVDVLLLMFLEDVIVTRICYWFCGKEKSLLEQL